MSITEQRTLTPEQQAALEAAMREQAAQQEEYFRVTRAYADILVQREGPEAANVALFVLQSFVRQYAPRRQMMPPQIQKLITAAEAATVAASEIANQKVVLAQDMPPAPNLIVR